MKVVITLLLGLGLGYFWGKHISPTVTQGTPVAYSNWSENGIKKIEEVKDASLQLAEAERYYGKAVVLFLATLYNKTQDHPGGQAIGNAVEEKIESGVVTEAPRAPEVMPSTPSSIASTNEKIVPEKAKETPSTKEDDLKRLIAYRGTSPATKMSPEVRKMIGSFEGVFVQEFGKNKGRVDRVEMDLMFDMQNGKLQGQTRIVLINPHGEIYSNSSGDGNNQTLKLLPGTKDQIYIETAPGEFIIMDLSRPNQLTGKYYDPGGTYRGSIQLSRK